MSCRNTTVANVWVFAGVDDKNGSADIGIQFIVLSSFVGVVAVAVAVCAALMYRRRPETTSGDNAATTTRTLPVTPIYPTFPQDIPESNGEGSDLSLSESEVDYSDPWDQNAREQTSFLDLTKSHRVVYLYKADFPSCHWQ